MNVGTKSVLFGAHCFLIHPWFVALAWWKLYGFPWDPRLWVAFFVHDLGYWGRPNMDGEEGERHPIWGAALMLVLFGEEWSRFTYYHSRFLAKQDGAQFSRLCVADKLAIVLDPWWLYLPRVIATGEIREYMALAAQKEGAKYSGEMKDVSSRRAWYRSMQEYLGAWVSEHRDGRKDTWTPATRQAADETGVWQ
jgi:hypothetical protein